VIGTCIHDFIRRAFNLVLDLNSYALLPLCKCANSKMIVDTKNAYL